VVDAMSDSSDEQSGDEEDVAGRGFLKRWEDSDALKGTLKSGVEILLESCFKQLEQMIRNDAIALPEEVKALPTKKEKIYRLALITLRCTGWQLCQSDAATGIDAGVATLLRFVLALDPTNDAVQELLENPSDIKLVFRYLLYTLPALFDIMCCDDRMTAVAGQILGTLEAAAFLTSPAILAHEAFWCTDMSKIYVDRNNDVGAKAHVTKWRVYAGFFKNLSFLILRDPFEGLEEGESMFGAAKQTAAFMIALAEKGVSDVT
jgi:hypothetical protein